MAKPAEEPAPSAITSTLLVSVGVDPLAGDRGSNVRLILVVGRNNLNALAEKVPTKILDSELRRDDRALTANISVGARLVVEDADPYDISSSLCLRGPCREGQRQST